MLKPRTILTSFFTATAFALSISVPSAHAAACGNGVINGAEACDDGNIAGSDGCSSTCMVESGFECLGTHPSVCALVVCGNGIVQAGEDCDGGACCLGDCSFASVATTCRGSAGVCDSAEVCSGSASSCPVDSRSTASCRASAGPCDPAESCDGTAVGCPVDTKSAGVCRASAGVCDLGVETCDGVGNDCPADALVTGGSPCRASVGACDIAEACTGVAGACPADAKATNACRASVGACDAAESCNGVDNNCPVDAKSTSECRASLGACDLAESCDGTADACPVDAKSDVVCRASTGVCDLGAETCDGVSNDCPVDVAAAAATPCRASTGSCDTAESCTGTSASCPVDAKSTGLCRASLGECDLAESCDGTANGCPVDAKSTAECRPAVSLECDAAESCDGIADACPDDILVGCADDDGVECTQPTCDVSGECVVTENCVEICRGSGYWSTHGGDEKGGTNVTQSVLDAVGSLSVCGQQIDATTALGDLDSALEGLCVRTQGVEERQLYRQLITTALNCSVSEGGTCDQIVGRFVDVSFEDCNALCAGDPVVDGPSVEECMDQLGCFNAGGRLVDGQCAHGNCEVDSGIFCGADYGPCPANGEVAQDCVTFEDSCSSGPLCSEDADAPAQICIKGGRASSPGACKEARKNDCTIDSCEQ